MNNSAAALNLREPAAIRGRRGVEWPTVALAMAVYGGWLGVTWWSEALPWWALLAAGAWLCAWQSSLQHEVMHGHPFRNTGWNRALGMPPLSLWLPFERYRTIHLTHHRDHLLTDPIEDPETQYMSLPAWTELGFLGRGAAHACTRLGGRVVIGPAWTIARFLSREARRVIDDAPGVRRAWLRHLPWLGAVLVWVVGVCRVDLVTYLLCFTLPGHALLLVRSFAEHRAAADHDLRTAIVERAPVLGLLFLYNNLHVAHHERPGLAWYRLPGFYRRERARLVAKNGGLVYAGYRDVARRFLLRAHDTPLHPREAAGAEPPALVLGEAPVA